MRVATLCGSHHSASTNAVVIATIAARLAAAGVEIESIDTSVRDTFIADSDAAARLDRVADVQLAVMRRQLDPVEVATSHSGGSASIRSIEPPGRDRRPDS